MIRIPHLRDAGSFGRRALMAAGLTLVATSAVAGVAAASPTSNRVTFGIGPATAAGQISRANFNYAATPGALLDDHCAVVNYSSIPLTLQLYPVDGIQTSSGTFGLSAPGQRVTGVGAWISLPDADAKITVPAASAGVPGEVVVPFTLRVPDSASPGDHVGAIVASLRTVGHNASGQTVILNQRIGSRVYVLVSGSASNSLRAQLQVRDVKVVYHASINPFESGSATVTYHLVNTGNLDLAVSSAVKVSGLLTSNGRYRAGKVPLLLPGASISETIPQGHVWPELISTASVSATGTPLVSGRTLAIVHASSSAWTWSVPWALVGLVIIIGAFVVWLARRRAAR